MAPSAALLIYLAVMAGAAANEAPAVEVATDLEPPTPVDAGGLPFLDYEDPPQIQEDSAGGQQILESSDPAAEESTPDVVEGDQPAAVDKDDFQSDDFFEDEAKEDPGDILEHSSDVDDVAEGQSIINVPDAAERLLKEDAQYELDAGGNHVEFSKDNKVHETHSDSDAHHTPPRELPGKIGEEKEQASQDHPEDSQDDPAPGTDLEPAFDDTPTARLQIDVQEEKQDEIHVHSDLSKESHELDAHHQADSDEQLAEENTHSLHALPRPQSVPEVSNAEPIKNEASASSGWHAPAADVFSSSGLVSSPLSFSVKEGGSLVLPCGRAALIRGGDLDSVWWYHSGRLLLGGKGTVSSDGRYDLRSDGSLRLTSAVSQDGGMFTCRVYGAAGDFTESSHHVHVQTETAKGGLRAVAAPALQVVTEPSDGVRVVMRGQATSLACWAPGEPTATVSWTKQEGVLPYGESVLKGARLEIGQVTPVHRGTYLCTVTTGDNRTEVRSLHLQVNFSPEVTALEPVVHSAEDHQAVLRCQVQAHPPPQVNWRRPSGRALRPGHHLVSQEGDTFQLAMLVETDDLDTYICTAVNGFGSAEATVVLTGRPGQPVVTSSNRSSQSQSYTVRWRVSSASVPRAYKLLYRRRMTDSSRPLGYWRTAWLEAFIPVEDASDEHDADDTDDDDDDDDDHHHQYVIRDLKPGSEYEVHVLAQNRHGWSKPSESFLFRTASAPEKKSGVRQNRPDFDATPGGNSAADMRASAATLLLAAVIGPMIHL